MTRPRLLLGAAVLNGTAVYLVVDILPQAICRRLGPSLPQALASPGTGFVYRHARLRQVESGGRKPQ
jgi:hypothetical protein